MVTDVNDRNCVGSSRASDVRKGTFHALPQDAATQRPAVATT